MQMTLGTLFGILVALLAWRLGSLSESGALAAALMGSLIFGLGGLPWAVLLLGFFITSSGFSRLFKTRKAGLGEKHAKGSRRDWAQVFANGGLGILLVLAQWLYPEQTWHWVAFAGALAAVNADTWATELGVLSPSAPRLITSGRRVEMGVSGGVTLVGSLASLAGAALIGALAALFPGEGAGLQVIPAAALGGLAGSLFDSLLGATLQAIYTCPVCQKETERHPTHTCGAATVRVRGLPWLDNDMVNFAASLMGALAALLLYWLF